MKFLPKQADALTRHFAWMTVGSPVHQPRTEHLATGLPICLADRRLVGILANMLARRMPLGKAKLSRYDIN